MNDRLEARKYWIALNMIPGIGPITFRKLLNVFESPEQVFSASYHQLTHVPGISNKTAQKILTFGFPDSVKRELEAIDTQRVRIVTWNDSDYPAPLKTIFDPPPVLYMRGRALQTHELMIAIVGSRQASSYGRGVAEQLSAELTLKGVTIVSGMARGIDSFAHRGTMHAGGFTVAVLGCGVNIIYPPENTQLYHDILEHGTIISELPLDSKPDRRNFPARNRIISGLSMGTVVVEAGVRSGALITADMALEQGREVFAVPGNINSGMSKGTNHLIKQGAGLVEHADDVLNALSIEIGREVTALQKEFPFQQPATSPPLNTDEQKVYELIETSPIHIDDITVQSQLPSGNVSAILMMLEMKNVIRQLAGKTFVRV